MEKKHKAGRGREELGLHPHTQAQLLPAAGALKWK